MQPEKAVQVNIEGVHPWNLTRFERSFDAPDGNELDD